MEHTQALEMNAPDRYVLGQLSAAEADAFEEHYFDCTACAEDVRLGMSIMEGGRLLVQQGDEPVAPAVPLAPVVPIDSRGKWGRWIPAAAVAAVMAIPVHFALLMRTQNAVPRMTAIVAADEVLISLPNSRGENDDFTLVLAEGEYGLLLVHVPPGASCSRCEAQILRGQELVHTASIRPALISKERLTIQFPDPGPGTYEVVILGFDPAGKKTEITRGQFNVERSNSSP